MRKNVCGHNSAFSGGLSGRSSQDKPTENPPQTAEAPSKIPRIGGFELEL